MMPSLRGGSAPPTEPENAVAELPAAPLTGRVANDASAGEIAEAIDKLWLDIGAALQPVIGRRGVTSLFDRALHLTAVQYPWLRSVARRDADAAVDSEELKKLLSMQAPEMAVEAGSAMFMIFRDLLTTLIGAPLTERLLRSAWSPRYSAPWRKASTP